jgi:hypothetical protein
MVLSLIVPITLLSSVAASSWGAKGLFLILPQVFLASGHEIRFTSNPPLRYCEFESIEVHEPTQTSIDQWAGSSIGQQAQAEIASLIALIDAPLEIVEEGAFHRLLNALVHIGREDREFQFGRDRFPLTRYRTRKAIIDESIGLSDRILRQFAERPYLSGNQCWNHRKAPCLGRDDTQAI